MDAVTPSPTAHTAPLPSRFAKAPRLAMLSRLPLDQQGMTMLRPATLALSRRSPDGPWKPCDRRWEVERSGSDARLRREHPGKCAALEIDAAGLRVDPS